MSSEILKGKYRPEIDGLRAFAVVAVIINHFNKNFLPNGYLGVDIFFVISGYVITSSLLARKSKDFREFIGGFYTRRLRRLIPALTIFIIISSILICLFNKSPGLSLKTGIFSLFGISNLFLFNESTDYFSILTQLNMFTHTWSLGVEEQFYFLFPFLFWFNGCSSKSNRSLRNLSISLLILSLFSFLIFIYFYQNNEPAAYFLMPSRFWEIASGSLIFLIIQKDSKLEEKLEKISPSLIILFIISLMLLPVKVRVITTLLSVIFTLLLLISLKRKTALFKIFTQKRIVLIGQISYPLYLWHWGVLCISRWTIGIHWWTIPFQIMIMFFLAINSYKYIEKPFQKIKFKSAYSAIFSCILIIILSTLFLLFINKNRETIYLGEKDNRLSTNIIYGSTKSGSLPRELCNSKNLDLVNCSLEAIENLPLYKKTIFLVGDSNALALNSLLEEINLKTGAKVISSSISSTAFPGIKSNAKSKFDSDKLINLQKKIKSDILVNFNTGDILLISNVMQDYLKTSKDIKLYSDEFLNLAKDIKEKGGKIILMRPIPRYTYTNYGSICSGQWFQLECKVNVNKLNSRKNLLNRVSIANDLYDSLEKNYPENIKIVDTFNFICPKDSKYCPLKNKNNKMFFYDNIHLNNFIARELSGIVIPLLVKD